MALTANKEIIEKEGVKVSLPCAVANIFKGAIVKVNAAGYAAPMAAEASAFMAGIAESVADNSGGSAGDLSVDVKTEGMFLLSGSGFSIADVGSDVYASADDTISTTQGTNEIKVGKILQIVSATQVWVKINSAVA